MKIATILFFGAALVGDVDAASFPYNPEPLNDYSGINVQGESARLKITAVIENSPGMSKLRIAGVVVCSKIACYRPNVQNGGVGIGGGIYASSIVDSTIPLAEIESVHIESAHGSNIFSGSLRLARPLDLTKGYQGGEILVTFQSTKNDGLKYAPSFATSTVMHETQKAIYYVPAFQTVAKVGNGVSIEIPSGATANPEIFSVVTHDTGERFPLVDIYPVVNFKKAITVSAQALKPKATLMPKAPRVPHPTAAQINGKMNETESGNSQRLFMKTGVIDSAQFETKMSPSGATAPMAVIVDIPGPCASDIATNLAYIRSFLNQTGVVNINWCLDRPPYMHITYTNLKDPRIRYTIPNTIARAPDGIWKNPLYRIQSFGGYAMTAVNGFTWKGDYGHQANGYGYGLSLGYVWSNGTEVAGNRFDGGAGGGSSANAGKKVFIAHAANAGDPPWTGDMSDSNYQFGFYGRPNVISSSTSVLRWTSSCTVEGTKDRWTAIGVKDGVMIQMSSKSGSETTVNEMCDVFKAFGVETAIRMDGGGSASMLIDNQLVNPLTGLYYAAFGVSRAIPYHIRISW